MKRAIFLYLCFFMFAWQAVAIAPSDPLPPTKLVDNFYGAYRKLAVSGLPNAKQAEAIKPFLSDGLNKILAVARQKQADAIKRHPGDKPLWDDGDLFSSLFEGAQHYKVNAATITGHTATVPVQLDYSDHKSVIRWTDNFVLMLENNRWRITDVKMGGYWQFKEGSSLRGILTAQ